MIGLSRLPPAAACALLLALAACGGGGTPTLTQREYAARLSRLCLVSADRLRELHLDTKVTAWRANGRLVLATERSFNRRLAALEPPAAIQSAVAAYTNANDRSFRDTEAAVAAARAGNASKLRAGLRRAGKDDLATGTPAKTIGASGCYIG
jgi:hypothetical protein